MKFMRGTADYTLLGHKQNEGMLIEFRIHILIKWTQNWRYLEATCL